MEAIAKTKYLKGSPRKARLVIDMIRGVNVSKALNILKFTDKRAADPIAKTLRSAIANATNLAEKQNIAIDPDDLFVKSCFVDMGPTKNRRRMRPAPQGRAYREQRHYCHITIQVSSDKPEEGTSRNAKVGENAEETAKSASKQSAAKKTNAGERTAKASAKKSDEVKETKKAKTPKTEEAASETAAETKSPKATKASKKVTQEEAKGDAQAADVKDTQTQQPAELNETKRADEKQQDVNEELERQ